jgi:hypothetical protein
VDAHPDAPGATVFPPVSRRPAAARPLPRRTGGEKPMEILRAILVFFGMIDAESTTFSTSSYGEYGGNGSIHWTIRRRDRG